ncbi:hypothetical protein H310_02335 [Aphanomyces invadans]|uniref:Uncharacterized protein n=1 Tax=Aphanomyces invadans TaxID=157072 RepID=A0A024UP51_9STRA|nr:hypothetical protein H310_02335 [Aphanomyces invadans]ETW07935.1 hypothetical protein H310_02335 [Aphanomyces invadans]|eukprot:XP_008864028.1 hypothetical protein H310_02335 [Aphanomyces invadans]
MDRARSRANPSTLFQHRDVLIGFRSTYVPKPEGDAGPQSYAVRCSFHPPSTPPSIEVRRSLQKRYGRDFCRAQRKPARLPRSPPHPVASPPRPAAATGLTTPGPPSRRHVRSHSLTMLTLGKHPPQPNDTTTRHDHPTPGKHMRSRSFSISELTVSHLLDPPPPSPPKTSANPRINLKWRTFGEHLWHEKSKMLLNALILTPPRHLYIERKNEVQNPLFHDDGPCHSGVPTRCSIDDGTNLDSFIAGYFRNMSTAKPERRESRRRSSTIKRTSVRETTEAKWSRWRRYPENKRPEWTSLASPIHSMPTSMRRSGGVPYTDFLAHGNSYRQRAGLKALVRQS